MIEPDRFKENKTVFIVAMVALLLCLILITLSLYLFPYLMFGWNYQVPMFVPNVLEWMNSNYAIRGMSASLIVFLSLFIPGVIAGVVSEMASNAIEKHIYGLEKNKDPHHEHLKQEVKASAEFGLKLFFILIAAVLVLLFIVWMMQSTTTPY